MGKGKGADGTPDTGYCIWTFEKGKVKTFTAIGADTDLWVKMRKGESVEGKGTNLPSFEPHDDPASLFWPVFQEWGKGTFAGANPELSKQAAMEKFWHKDIVWDVESTAHPALGASSATRAPTTDQRPRPVGLDPAAMKVTCVNGPTPGTCVHSFGFDMKHKETGRRRRGSSTRSRLRQGWDVPLRQGYWGNPKAIAATMPAADAEKEPPRRASRRRRRRRRPRVPRRARRSTSAISCRRTTPTACRVITKHRG